MNIAEEVELANLQICVLEVFIEEMQELCKHPNAHAVGKSSTGNYDPTQDCSWWEYDCPDCDKHWTDGLR